MHAQKRVSDTRRRASTGNKNYRELTSLSDDDDDYTEEHGSDNGGSSTPQQTTPALKEAREQCKNNLRMAWESIFTRYSQGQHLAAGKDDVFDFGTGEVVEDAGFLDDFIVEDDDELFGGRSIEIGDFGLPGASGMNDLTDSSSEEEDLTPTISRRSSFLKSESGGNTELDDDGSEDDEISGDDLLLASPSRSANRRKAGTSNRHAKTSNGRRRISRSVSMPESIDLLSSSDDELGQRDVHPVSDRFKEIKRIRTSMKEDLKEFEEAENARLAKEEAERVKRERTATPFLGRLGTPNVAHLRAQSIRPLPRSAPSSYRPYVSSSLARNSSITPSKSHRLNTPSHSSPSSAYISVKPESSTSSFMDVKPFRASSSRPQGRCFSLKPNSSSSSSAPTSSNSCSAPSAIPLGHYSNTLLNQAVACEDDSSDDEIAIRSPSTRMKVEERTTMATTYTTAHSYKGKERAKEEEGEDIQSDNVFLDTATHVIHQFTTSQMSHLPSPPPSKTCNARRKRSPTFYSGPTASTIPPTSRPQSLRPVVEIVRSGSRQPQRSPRISPQSPTKHHAPPHTVPRMAASSRLQQYRPKQSSPLKASSNHPRRPSEAGSPSGSPRIGRVPNAPIDISSDEDDDIPLRSFALDTSNRREAPSPAQYTSPTKRKYPTSPESPESPTSRARMLFPTPPRSFSSSTVSLPEDLRSPSTPSVPLAKMSLTTLSSSTKKSRHAIPIRRPKEETPDTSLFASRAIKREESIVPPPLSRSLQQQSHLPTPPLSSGSSASAFRSCKEETPSLDVKPEEVEIGQGEVFKVPSPRRRHMRMSSVLPRIQSSTTMTSTTKGKGKAKEESPELELDAASDDDEIMLISPMRPNIMKREIRTPPPSFSPPHVRNFIRADSLVRSGSIVRGSGSSPRRAPSIARPLPKPSPTITRDRPPVDNEGYESDDPLGI